MSRRLPDLKPIQQPAFSAGEASPSVAARVDQERYGISAKTLRNFIVQISGGAANRPGLRFVAAAKTQDKAVALLKFQFSTDQSYVIEAGHNYLRFIRRGGVQLLDGPPVEVATPYSNDEVLDLWYSQSADVMTIVHPNHKPRELKRISETNWTLTELDNEEGPFLDINTNEALFIHASAETGTVTLTATAPVFNANHVGALMYLEEENLSKVRPWEPSKEITRDGYSSLGFLRRNDGKTYECQSSFPSGVIFTGTIPPTHEKGSAMCGSGNQIAGVGAKVAGLDWLYLHSGYGIVRITAYTSATQVTAVVVRRLPATVVGGAQTGATTSHTGDGSTVTFAYVTTSNDPLLVDVLLDGELQPPTSYTVNSGTNQITFAVAPAGGVAITFRRLTQSNRTSVWAFGAWSADQGYPSVVTYYADRQVFAATPKEPQSLWMSRTGRYRKFSRSTPLQADDRITATINSREVNAIRDVVPLSSMVLLTSGGEWKGTAGEDGVLSPETFDVKPQTFFGAERVRSVVVGNTAMFAQKQGGAVREISYSFDDDGYNGGDLTIWSDHLFGTKKKVRQLSYHQAPYSVVWAVRSDGALLSLTYMKDQGVLAWARHDTGNGDLFEQVCTIDGDDEDETYVVVRRFVDGAWRRYIERVETRDFESIEHAFFVDSGLSYDGRNTGATTMAISAWSNWGALESGNILASASTFVAGDVGNEIELRLDGKKVRLEITAYNSATNVTARALSAVPAEIQDELVVDWTFKRRVMTGLSHLEGRTVSVLSDGNVEEQKVVTSGQITLDRPGGIVHIGLPIEADLETLAINDPSRETVRGRKKTVPSVTVVVDESRGLFAGSGPDSLYEYKQRTDETYEEATRPKTGLARIEIAMEWGDDGRVFMRQSDPLPLTVLSVIPEVLIGG